MLFSLDWWVLGLFLWFVCLCLWVFCRLVYLCFEQMLVLLFDVYLVGLLFTLIFVYLFAELFDLRIAMCSRLRLRCLVF